MKKLMTILLTIVALQANAQKNADDEKNIIAACNDYIDAFYKADTTYAYRSVHKLLQKRGFAWSKQKAAYSNQLEMPFPALVKLATTWNANGKAANSESIRTIRVLDIEDKTATAKITAVWGIDYIQLVKETDGKWMIMNVLWQSLPTK